LNWNEDGLMDYRCCVRSWPRVSFKPLMVARRARSVCTSICESCAMHGLHPTRVTQHEIEAYRPPQNRVKVAPAPEQKCFKGNSTGTGRRMRGARERSVDDAAHLPLPLTVPTTKLRTRDICILRERHREQMTNGHFPHPPTLDPQK
jgi:hypothetical protein